MCKNPVDAVCVLTSDIKQHQNLHGIVTFHQCSAKPSTTRIHFEFTGLKPNAIHAIHIHEYGDLRKGCDSLGGHWNPYHTTHGSILYPKRPRHAGDLINNIVADENGSFYYEYDDPLITLKGKENIIGRSVVVHEHPDDLGRGSCPESLTNGCAGKESCVV